MSAAATSAKPAAYKRPPYFVVPERLLRVTFGGRECWAHWLWVHDRWVCHAVEVELRPLRYMGPAQAKAWLDVRGLSYCWSATDVFAEDRWRPFPEWLSGVWTMVPGAEWTMDLPTASDEL